MMMSILKHLTAPIKEASYFSRQCRASQTPLNLCVSSSEASGLSLLTFPGLAKVRETYRGVSGIQHWETYFSSNHTQSCQSFSQIWFFFFLASQVFSFMIHVSNILSSAKSKPLNKTCQNCYIMNVRLNVSFHIL